MHLSSSTTPMKTDLDWLATAWLRRPDLFRHAAKLVNSTHFLQGEEHYHLLWCVLSELYQRHREVSQEMVRHGCGSKLASGTVPALTSAQSDVLFARDGNGLISAAAMLQPSEFSLAYTCDILQRFLDARAVLLPLRQLLEPFPTGPKASETLKAIEVMLADRPRVPPPRSL
jgi:hypothetical protein